MNHDQPHHCTICEARAGEVERLRVELRVVTADRDRLDARMDLMNLEIQTAHRAMTAAGREQFHREDIEGASSLQHRIGLLLAEVERLRAVLDSALCVLVEGPEVMEPGEATREAKRILSSALAKS